MVLRYHPLIFYSLGTTYSITGSKTITYTYDASGQKLRRVSPNTGNTDYINGIQYDGTNTTASTISFIQTEEGKAVPNGATAYNYTYYLGDNLGNTRVTFDTGTGVARTLQKDDYYPFGMEILRDTLSAPKNEYLYNKKELQEELTEYDYGARFYDPVIGRFTTIDPLSEKNRRFTSYAYGDDNPIRNIDPDGMETLDSEIHLHGAAAQDFFRQLQAQPGGRKRKKNHPLPNREVMQKSSIESQVPLKHIKPSPIDISRDGDVGGGFSMTNNDTKRGGGGGDASKNGKAPSGSVTALGDMSVFFNGANFLKPSPGDELKSISIFSKFIERAHKLNVAGDAADPIVDVTKEAVKILRPVSHPTWTGYWLDTTNGRHDTITINNKGFTGNAIPLYIYPNGKVGP